MDDLVTARLVLHPLSPAEATRLLANEPDGSVPWAPGYPAEDDLAGARRFLTACAGPGDPQPFGPYEIRRREDGHAIGGLEFHATPDENGSVTIGYGLVPAAQGQGYASEAVRELLRLARALGVTRVKGDADLDNTASQHVMTAVGMRWVAEDERVRYYEIAFEDDTDTLPGNGEKAEVDALPGSFETAEAHTLPDAPSSPTEPNRR